jgi:hypothetical protein
MAPIRQVDTSSLNADIRRIVKNNHVRILALFHLYLDSLADSRRAIAQEILHQLASQLKGEELLFHAIRVAGPEVRMLIGDAELEFEEVKAMTYKLQQSEPDDRQAWDNYFKDMMQSVRALFMTEERDLLPLIDRSLDA